jgi:hypothetical protein
MNRCSNINSKRSAKTAYNNGKPKCLPRAQHRHFGCAATVIRKPKKRHSSNMIADLKREKMENANPQKQEFGSPSLQPSLRCQTHAFFPTHAD